MNGLGNKEIMAKNIKYYMQLHNKERGDICNDLGISYSTFTEWVNANKYPRIDKIEMMARYFGIQKSDLIEERERLSNTINTSNFESESLISFPVVGNIAAGYNGLAVEEYTDDTIDIPVSMLRGRKPQDYFVLRVTGHSMHPQFVDGDKVLVQRCSSVDSGSVAVVLYNGEESTVKRVKYVAGENWLELIPTNPDYMTKRIEGSELEECQVLGKVVMLLRDIV